MILSIERERKEERQEEGERNKNKEQKHEKEKRERDGRGREKRQTEMVFILQSLSSWYTSSVRIELKTDVSGISFVSIIRHADSDDGGTEGERE
jgi:hypothetical protein